MQREMRHRLWAEIQREGSSFFSKSRQAFLIRFLRKGQKVLNIGIGDMTFEKLALANGIDVYSIDPDKETVDNLGKMLKMGPKVRVGLAEHIPFEDNAFEAVVASEVLEHLDDIELMSAIKEIHRVLKCKGFFLGTVPADENLEEEVVFCPFCEHRFHRWGHLQSFSERRLYTLLTSKFYPVNVKRIYIDELQKLNWKGKLHFFVKSLSLRLGYRGKGAKFFFRAVKP